MNLKYFTLLAFIVILWQSKAQTMIGGAGVISVQDYIGNSDTVEEINQQNLRSYPISFMDYTKGDYGNISNEL
jgi:hypothetical protein